MMLAMRMGKAMLACVAGACLACAIPAGAQNAAVPLHDRVLVVYNGWYKDSQKVAKYYMAKRNIPEGNKCALKIDDQESEFNKIIPFAQYEEFIKKPIKKCLQTVGKEKILYIVMAYYTPFAFKQQPKGYGRAIDQYVSDIWDETGNAGKTGNPYFSPEWGIRTWPGKYVPFSEFRSRPGAKTIYSVWRLDGHSANEAEALVDRALQGEAEGLHGQVCIDRNRGEKMSDIPQDGYGEGDWDLHRAAEWARQAKFKVVEDYDNAEFGTPPAPLRCDNAALYAGWYSLNTYHDVFGWNPGAIGIHLDSGSAMDPRGGPNWAANAIAHGITLTSGAVDEPYLEGLPRPDVAFAALFQGANAGDALFASVRWIRWMIINLGDPLYRPFPKGRLEGAP